jgi:eukaryotic-like serine/threonine-protein kinase
MSPNEHDYAAMTPERWQKVKEILEAALELQPAHRQGYLERACSNDLSLREEVDSLLRVNAQMHSTFLDVSALERVSLAKGSQLGPYIIVSPLGAGGMGEVYRAHDPRLSRDVAVKILPSISLADGDRLRRFEQEARAVAALNHPAILAVFDINVKENTPYLVSELLEGENLRERLNRGPLPQRKVVEYAVQIAQGLAVAHAKGVVHRDLKPENLFVTNDDRVKILDFGLAKLMVPIGGSEVTASTIGLKTEPGTVMGTLGYMSPEQVCGQVVDPRSDIFSFGAVLYEMLSGEHAFQGKSPAEVITAILTGDPPDLSGRFSGISPGVNRLVRRCLEKNPDQRFHSARDVAFALEAISDTVREPAASLDKVSGAPTQRSRTVFFYFALIVIVTLFLGLGIWYFRQVKPSRTEWTQLTDFADSVSSPALSPDGKMLAFLRSEGTFFGPGQIYVELLPAGEPVQVTHDDSVKMGPVFSPDGARVAYGTIEPWDTWVVPVLGGEPQVMLRNASGLSWTDTQHVLFSEIGAVGVHMSIVTATESRANERNVYVPARERGMAHRSYLSPDGKWVLIVEMDNAVWLPCRLVPFDGSGDGKQVGPPGAACTSAAWSPDGREMYFSSAEGGRFHVWRQKFPEGMPQQVTSGPTQEEGIAVAPDGRSLITAVGSNQSTIWIRDGRGERRITSEGYAADAELSADAKRVYYIVRPSGELRSADVATLRSEPLLPGFSIESYRLSADGKSAVFAALGTDSKPHIWFTTLDHRSSPRQISHGAGESSPMFTPAGDVLFRASEGAFNFAYRMKQDGSEAQKVFADPILDIVDVSPDGQWLIVFPFRKGEGSAFLRVAYPLQGGLPMTICSALCGVRWATNGTFMAFHFFLDSPNAGAMLGESKTVIVPLRRGTVFPHLPVSGVESASEAASLPGARVIEGDASPALDPTIYAFVRTSVHRNLYRFPIP